MSETRKITLQFPSLRAFLAQYGERISAEGMLLRGEAPPAAGTKVDIEVVVAAGMRLLRARGETLWSGAGAAGGRQLAAAVRFQDLDEASRKLIDKIVEQRRREGAEPFRLADVPGPREARLLDLTMPAAAIDAEPAEPDAASPDGIFDLGESPTAPTADLFDSGAPARTEPAAQERKLKAPVPLLADPEPDPFDLGPPPPGLEEGLEATDARLDQPREGEAEPAVSVDADLNNLFGRDEPRQSGTARTEAFPPSFVDEVEAELRATEEPDSSYLDVDTSELQLQLGAPVTEPVTDSGQPGESVPAPPVEPAAETAGEVEPDPEVEVELELEDEPSAALAPAPTPAIELEPEPGPASAIELESAPAQEPEPTPEPAATPDVVPKSDLAKRVAEAFDAAQGPETVEIPILATPSPPPASPGPEPEPLASPAPEPPPASPGPEPSPTVGGNTPPLTERPAVSPPAAAPPPPTLETPAVPPRPPGAPVSKPVAPMDDNLLSLPELKTDKTAVAAPPPPVEVPSSAEALRGAARSSRHLGTWLLIALLAGALAFAGYLLWGLSRDDGSPPQPVDRSGATATAPARSAAEPAAPVGEVGADTAGEDAAPSAPGAETESPPEIESEAAPEPPETPPAATDETAAAEPAAPLTGLDRITWSETGQETVLSLVADGSIERRGVELDTISGAQPRLVLKITGVQRAFQPAVLEVGTAQVDRVRTGLHPGEELHVVVDLAAQGVEVRDLAVGNGRVELRLGTGTE